MTKTGAMTSDVHTFYHTIAIRDGTLVREKFEWRHSGEPEVEALATENHPGENITQEKLGLKLVRVSTGKTLAAFAGGKHQRNYNPKRVAGKLRFVGSQILDPLVVVMSILSIIERSRQNAVWDARGGRNLCCCLTQFMLFWRSWCLGVDAAITGEPIIPSTVQMALIE
jgi:hypothetical protein